MLTLQTAKDPKFVTVREQNLLKALHDRRVLTLIVEAASSCNLKCTFCDAHSGRAPKFKEHAGVMKPETWVEVLGTIEAYTHVRGALEMLQFYGNGEPLLNKRLAPMIAEARARGVAKKTRVITNGILLTPEKLNELADAGLDEIHISIDTINAERYFDVKKGDYADRVTENIEACIPVIEARRDVQIFIKYFTKETSNAYGMTEEDSIEVQSRFIEKARQSDFVHLKEMPLVDVGLGMLENKEDYLTPCEIPFYLLYIMHDGKVSACCSDVFNGMTVGRLAPPAIPTPKPAPVTSLLDIVDGERLYDLRKKHLDGRCNEIKLCAGCGNRTKVDLSKFTPETIADINTWILPSMPQAAE